MWFDPTKDTLSHRLNADYDRKVSGFHICMGLHSCIPTRVPMLTSHGQPVVYMGNRGHKDALWEEGKLMEAAWRSCQFSAENLWVL